MTKIRVGVLLSGSGTNLQALLHACSDPGFPAEIAVVVSNRRSAYGLTRAEQAGVRTAWVARNRFETTEDWEDAVAEALGDVIWVACAGFMRLLSPHFLARWPDRVLNIHPALLPAFPGVDGQGQAYDHGVRIAGCTVHLVDAGTDTGPIIAQGAVPVLPGDDRDALQRRILGVEHVLYPRVLRWAAEGRLSVEGRTVRVATDEPTWVWGGP